jgi:hypothetical protein
LLEAQAALAATVVLVQPAKPAPGMTQALVRIHGELVSAGFDLEIVDASVGEGVEGESRDWLEQLATSRGADAGVAMMGSESLDSVEGWVIDKGTGKAGFRRVPYQSSSARGSETLAIQAIELLRASFLEIDLKATSRPSEPKAVPPPTVVRFLEGEKKAERAERLGIELGGAGLMSLDGVGPAVLPVARVDWVLRPWLLAHATVAGLGSRPRVQTQAGSARVAHAFVALGASYRFRADKRVRPFVFLAPGLLHTSVEGLAEPSTSYQGLRAARWSFLLDGGFGVGVPLFDRCYSVLAAHAQVAEPYPAIRFADERVATAGRPSLMLTLTLGAWL